MKDIKVVLENLSIQSVTLDNAQTSFLEKLVSAWPVMKTKIV